MNINEAYTVYNNQIQSVGPLLAEALDRILDEKNKQLEKLDRTELAEVKARMEVEEQKKEIEQLRTGIVELREYIGYQPHSDLAENVVDILYKILKGEIEAGESNAI